MSEARSQVVGNVFCQDELYQAATTAATTNNAKLYHSSNNDNSNNNDNCNNGNSDRNKNRNNDAAVSVVRSTVGAACFCLASVDPTVTFSSLKPDQTAAQTQHISWKLHLFIKSAPPANTICRYFRKLDQFFRVDFPECRVLLSVVLLET